MKKIIKKIQSLVLALILVGGLSHLTVSAEEIISGNKITGLICSYILHLAFCTLLAIHRCTYLYF